jgi:acetolactate synthase-1/2/3 large subunit
MKKTGAELVRFALEQIGVRFTFGIPGVHNTEIYDQLAGSGTITPIRVSHECGGAFMADAVSRVADHIGTLLIVPAAGPALAAGGIGEAFLDGIPMLVISGGTRTDTGRRYQLHEIDQLKMVEAITKARWRATEHRDIVPTLYEAYRTAMSGEPGPVFVEIPVNIQLFPGEIDALPAFQPLLERRGPDAVAVDRAVKLLQDARRPGLFLGWGARDATDIAIRIAEVLAAPVATTLQGLSVFPGNHPLHTGMGIGPAAVPAAENAFRDCDVLLAVGTRFGEIATGSFGIEPSWTLIHSDINPRVFNANYPAEVTIEGDARRVLQALLDRLLSTPATIARDAKPLQADIARDKNAYLREWLSHDSKNRVNPGRFFQALRSALPDDAYVVVDDGNHTFLAAELFPVHSSKHFLSPTDFNCMGYCVPAAIGARLAHTHSPVVGIVGDGAFLMTGLEIGTAAEHGLGVVYFVFNDGELSQISQAQKLPYNRKACTVLPEVRIRGIAEATGAVYLRLENDAGITDTIGAALREAAQNRPVVVDVNIDYSKQTRFTKGILKTNLNRLALSDKLRIAGRALWRRLLPPASA